MIGWLHALQTAPARDAGILILALGGLLLFHEERRRPRRLFGLTVLAALAAALALGAPPAVIALLVITALAWDARDPLQTECAAKLMWVLAPAMALSVAGNLLLVMASGTDRPLEQWSVLGLGLEARFLWSGGLALSLLMGLVLLGVPPFHFWIADLLQGARGWLAVPAVVALQWAGADWLGARLHGISDFPEGAAVAQTVMRVAVVAGLIAGALTLLVQRRPERRVGSLASLQGALAAVGFAAGDPADPVWLGRWSAHLGLALMGAATLSRFLPESAGPGAPAGSLARRHRWTTVAGLLCWSSLAGIPGTPGSLLWLEAGHRLLRAGLAGNLLVLIGAWLVTLTASVSQVRETFGLPSPNAARPNLTPRLARAVPWAALAGLVWVIVRGAGR